MSLQKQHPIHLATEQDLLWKSIGIILIAAGRIEQAGLPKQALPRHLAPAVKTIHAIAQDFASQNYELDRSIAFILSVYDDWRKIYCEYAEAVRLPMRANSFRSELSIAELKQVRTSYARRLETAISAIGALRFLESIHADVPARIRVALLHPEEIRKLGGGVEAAIEALGGLASKAPLSYGYVRELIAGKRSKSALGDRDLSMHQMVLQATELCLTKSLGLAPQTVERALKIIRLDGAKIAKRDGVCFVSTVELNRNGTTKRTSKVRRKKKRNTKPQDHRV